MPVKAKNILTSQCLYPPLERTVFAVCADCGNESRFCAKVCTRPSPTTGKWGDARMLCACCRERHVKRWRPVAGWNPTGEDHTKHDGLFGEDWERWKREHPPLSDAEIAEVMR